MNKALAMIIAGAVASMASLTAAAQDYPAWQIGGGYGVGNQQTFPFGAPNTSRSSLAYSSQGGGFSYTALFKGDHEDAATGFSIGYIHKFWRTDFGTHTWHENFWGEEDKRLHGIQLGVTYQPCLPVGLGLHTGLFWEMYFSVSPAVKEMGWDNFTEHGLYVPLHAMWRIPLGYETSLMLYGGLGMNWAISGTYNDEHDEDYYDFWEGWVHDHWTESEHAAYGRGDWPRRLNFSTEFGATFRVKQVQLSVTISNGITDHAFYHKEGHYKTTQDKLAVSLSFLPGY